MGIAIALAQYLVDRGVAYDLVPHPRTETASASAAAGQVPAIGWPRQSSSKVAMVSC
jgi:hypothetical protein